MIFHYYFANESGRKRVSKYLLCQPFFISREVREVREVFYLIVSLSEGEPSYYTFANESGLGVSHNNPTENTVSPNKIRAET
jgi:hypothetical protein